MHLNICYPEFIKIVMKINTTHYFVTHLKIKFFIFKNFLYYIKKKNKKEYVFTGYVRGLSNLN